jgi:hypothetical protein
LFSWKVSQNFLFSWYIGRSDRTPRRTIRLSRVLVRRIDERRLYFLVLRIGDGLVEFFVVVGGIRQTVHRRIVRVVIREVLLKVVGVGVDI